MQQFCGCVFPPWRQPRGKWMVSLVNFHTNATRIGWHLWEIDLRFAPGLPPGWFPTSFQRRVLLDRNHRQNHRGSQADPRHPRRDGCRAKGGQRRSAGREDDRRERERGGGAEDGEGREDENGTHSVPGECEKFSRHSCCEHGESRHTAARMKRKAGVTLFWQRPLLCCCVRGSGDG